MPPQPDNVPSTSNEMASEPETFTLDMDPDVSPQESPRFPIGMVTNEKTTNNVVQDKSEEENLVKRKTPEGEEAKELENRSSELLEIVDLLELFTRLSDVPSTSDQIPRRNHSMNLDNPTQREPPSLVMETPSDSIGSTHSLAGNPSTSNTTAGGSLRHPAPQVRPSNNQVPPNLPSLDMNEPYDLMEIANSLANLSGAVSTREASSNGPVQPVSSMNLPSSDVATPLSNKTRRTIPLSSEEARFAKLIKPIHNRSVVLSSLPLETFIEQVNDWVTKSGVDLHLFLEKVLKTPLWKFEQFMRSRNKLEGTKGCYHRLIKFMNLTKEVTEEILNLMAVIQSDLNTGNFLSKSDTRQLQSSHLETVKQIDNWIKSNGFTVKIFAEKILGCTVDEFLQSIREAQYENKDSGAYVKSMKFLALSEDVKKLHAVKVKTILAETEKRSLKIAENSAPATQKIHHTPALHQSSFTDHPHKPSTSNRKAGSSNGPIHQLPLARSNVPPHRGLSNDLAHQAANVGPRCAEAVGHSRKRKSNLPPSLEARLIKLIAPIHDDSEVSNTVNFRNITQLVDKWIEENKVNLKLFVKRILKTESCMYDMCMKNSNRFTWTDDCYKKMARFIGLSNKKKQEIREILEEIREEERKAFLDSINSAQPIQAVSLKEIGKPKSMPSLLNQAPDMRQHQPVPTERRMVPPGFPWNGEEYINQALADVRRNDRTQLPKPVSSPVPKKRQCQPDHIEKREALWNDQGSSSTSHLEGPSTSSSSTSGHDYDDIQKKSFDLLMQFLQPPDESVPEGFKPNMALLTQEFVQCLLQTEHGSVLWTIGQKDLIQFFENTQLIPWEHLPPNQKLHYWRIRIFLDFEKKFNKIEEQRPTTSSRGTCRQNTTFTEHQKQCLSQIYSTITPMPNKNEAILIGEKLELSPESVIMWFEVIQKAISNMIKP